jgi:hypothetical protein
MRTRQFGFASTVQMNCVMSNRQHRDQQAIEHPQTRQKRPQVVTGSA